MHPRAMQALPASISLQPALYLDSSQRLDQCRGQMFSDFLNGYTEVQVELVYYEQETKIFVILGVLPIANATGEPNAGS